jgi:para-nitrobenzyl esterase
MNPSTRPSKMLNRRTLLTQIGAVAGLNGLGALRGARALAASADAPVAVTEYGTVQGVDGKVLSFRGVPYGGPTAGPNRFLPPGIPVAWKGVRDVVNAGPRAMQLPDKTLGGQNIFTSPLLGPYFSGGRADAATTVEPQSENCLVLNVLTPSLHGRRPVMVYIHGGGFTQGSGALTLLSDKFVEEQDVVLVGINHRLSVFGYTFLGDLDPRYADSGNVGQLDLVAALKWVRNNISRFGGDSANVTIFGESGGGAKISCLLAMPQAKGLFHRAIIESGSARSVRTREVAADDTAKMLSALGLAPVQVGEIQSMSADKLLQATGRGGPVVDGRSVPHQTWTDGAPPEAAGVALLIGNCKDEATLFSMADSALFSLNWNTLKEREVRTGIPGEKADALIVRYRADYPKDSPSDLYFRIAADRGARSNAIAQAQAKVQQGSGDVYMYNFAWDTPIDAGRLRAFHTAELPLAMRLVLNPEAESLSNQIAGAWAGFARSGDPNHSGLPRWDKYTAALQATMVFDQQTRLVEHPAQEELALLQPYRTGTL